MHHDLSRPNRCQGIASYGQCSRDAQPGSSFCQRHGTHRNLAAEQDFNLYQFLKSDDRAKFSGMMQHESCKSLRTEVAMIRVLIEKQMNLRIGRPDLLSAYGTLNSLLLTSDQLVQSLYQLEQNLDALLAKPTLLAFGNELVSIVANELQNLSDNEPLIDKISQQVVLIVGTAGITDPENCLHTIAKKNKPLYQLLNPEYQNRLIALCEHEDAKHLREEIAIARMLLEERFNDIKSDAEFLAACGTLNSQLLTVAKLVQSAHKLEQKLGSLLAKPTLLAVGNKIVTTLVEELRGVEDYEALIDQISDKIIAAIVNISK